jgi:hypothetical protein
MRSFSCEIYVTIYGTTSHLTTLSVSFKLCFHLIGESKAYGVALFGWLYFWLVLMLMPICYERKILFHD